MSDMKQDAVAALRAALEEHHKWHLAQTATDEEFGICLAEAYAESTMCERTLAALQQATAPDEVQRLRDALASAERALSAIGTAAAVSNTYRVAIGTEAEAWAKGEAANIRTLLNAIPLTAPAADAEVVWPLYVAERIVDHYREGIAYEIGVSNLSVAVTQVERMIRAAMRAESEADRG